MITNNTFSVLFYVRKEKINKDGEIPIYCRVTVNGQRAEISAKRYIPPTKWNPDSNSVKGNNDLAKKVNEHLRIIRKQTF